MIYDTPLRKRHEAWASQETQRIAQHVADAKRPGAAEGQQIGEFEVTRFPYGPGDEQHQPMCELVESFGPVEPEYAAIRRDAGLFDACHRAVIEMRGDDRLDFLAQDAAVGVDLFGRHQHNVPQRSLPNRHGPAQRMQHTNFHPVRRGRPQAQRQGDRSREGNLRVFAVFCRAVYRESFPVEVRPLQPCNDTTA